MILIVCKLVFRLLSTHFLNYFLSSFFIHNRMFTATPYNGYLGSWDTRNVEDMESMFGDCPEFEGKGLSKWKTTSLTWLSWAVRSRICGVGTFLFKSAMGSFLTLFSPCLYFDSFLKHQNFMKTSPVGTLH